MNKIISGIASAVLAAVWLLYGLACESGGNDAWLFAKIPVLPIVGLDVPRVFVLFFAVAWLAGGFKLIIDGAGNVSAVNAYLRKLRAGKTAAQIFTEEVEAIKWPNAASDQVARHLVRDDPYAASVKAVMKRTGESLDLVVLYYKIVADALRKKCALIREAEEKLGASGRPPPEIAFPTVRVAEAAKRSVSDLLTKVDLSSAHNHALLSQGDLIYSYDGRLIETAEQLRNEAAKTRASDTVKVGILRHVKTTNNHPLTGTADTFVWQPLHLEMKGGAIEAKLENQGMSRRTQEPAASPASAAEPTMIRFACPACGKQLKCAVGSAGKKVRCPKCGGSVPIPTPGEAT